VLRWTDTPARDKWMRLLVIILPITWGLVAIVVRSPLALVVLAGIGNALFLMAVVVATLYLSRTETDPRIKDGSAFAVYLLISAVAVFAVGVISLVDMS
jgi:hypothetical protein